MKDCDSLSNFSPAELTYLSTTVANWIAQGLDTDSVSVLSSLFFGVGSSLGLIARQRDLLDSRCAGKSTPAPGGKTGQKT